MLVTFVLGQIKFLSVLTVVDALKKQSRDLSLHVDKVGGVLREKKDAH